jgi:Tol biopolymer transport system component
MGYMSPEQVRGKGTDARSDIFSFGAILYEMLAGRRAFHGDTAADTISAILTKEPPDLSETNRRIPESLDRIVRHCLEKSPESRFHSASDIAFDLEAISGTSLVSAPGAPQGAVAWGVRLRRAIPWLAIPAVVVGYLLGRQPAGKKTAGAGSAIAEVRKLTIEPGIESFPNLSPDASTVVYEAGPAGTTDIFLQRVGGHKPINLTKDCDKDDGQPAFSPSGDRIAFRSECGGGGLFVMGATGENIRRVTEFGFYPAWSPDEKEIAVASESFLEPYSRSGFSVVWAVEVATGRKRQVLASTDCTQPSWSPHGDRIACWGLRGNTGQRDIWTVLAKGETAGKPLAVTNDAPTDWNPFWSVDGRFLYFASDRGGSVNLWRVSIDEKSGRPLGDPESVILPAGFAGPLSASRDGRHMVYESRTTLPSIQRSSFDPVSEKVTGEPVSIFRSSLPILGFEVSPDGQTIIFASGGARQDLFIMRADGTGLRQLTDDPFKDRNMTWTPDGKRIFFLSDRGGSYETWSILPDGSGLEQVTRDSKKGGWWPVFSPDGSVFAVPNGVNSFLFRLGSGAGKGKLEPLPALGGEFWFDVRDWSPDGRKLAGAREGGSVGFGVALYSLESKTYELLNDRGSYPRFLPDGRRLLFLDKSAVWLIDSDSRKAHQVLAPASDSQLGHFAVTRDGRSIYALQQLSESDIWEASLGGAAKP